MPGSAIHINQNVNANQTAASLALQKSNKQFNDSVTVTDTSSVTFYTNKIMSFKLFKKSPQRTPSRVKSKYIHACGGD